MTSAAPSPLDFFAALSWLDGRPLMDTIEPYRRELFEAALFSFTDDGLPKYNRVLVGRAKKNFKSADLSLAMLYRFFVWPSAAGNDCFVIANDEEQAGDDLSLVKKLILVNPVLAAEVNIQAKEIVRKYGFGRIKILPAQDVLGLHGKTYLFVGFDEIHGYRNYDLFEALSPDPTRPDSLIWITSYAGIRHAAGIPLYDLLTIGKSGTDPRMLFSWHAADYTTDPALAGDDVTPEARANPSMAGWNDDGRYLADQRLRLPAHKFRRLHLNLPGAADGAAFSGEAVADAIVPGRRRLPPQPGIEYCAFVDMSGGTTDDAVLAVAHAADGRVVIDLVQSQSGRPPFNPRHAVAGFAETLRQYGTSRVTGDGFAGLTFAADFQERGVFYEVSPRTRSQLYERFEPRLNAGEVELPDVPKLQEQLLGLVHKAGGKIDHLAGDHDDYANAVAGAVTCLAADARPHLIRREALLTAAAATPALSAVAAVLWIDATGTAAVIFIGAPLTADAIVVLDFDRQPAGAAMIGDTAERLGSFYDEARQARPNALMTALLFVPAQWEALAAEAMEQAFLPRASQLMGAGTGACAIDPNLVAGAEMLLHGAAAHIAAGRLKMTAAALDRSRTLPLLGALQYQPGSRERIEDDALRMAVLLAIHLTLDVEGSAGVAAMGRAA